MPNDQNTCTEQGVPGLTTIPSPAPSMDPLRVSTNPDTEEVASPLTTKDTAPAPSPPPNTVVTTPPPGTTPLPRPATLNMGTTSPTTHPTSPIPSPTAEAGTKPYPAEDRLSYPDFITQDVIEHLNSANDGLRWLEVVKNYLRLENQFPSRVSPYSR